MNYHSYGNSKCGGKLFNQAPSLHGYIAKYTHLVDEVTKWCNLDIQLTAP